MIKINSQCVVSFSSLAQRIIITIAFLLVLINFSAAQRRGQKGLVTELSSGKRMLSNVQVIFKEASPAKSDDDGYFELLFGEKDYGDLLFLENISKDGYELVNESELKYQTLSKDSLKVVMCKAGLIAEMKAKYYDISLKAFTQNYEQKQKELLDLLKRSVITEKEFQKELDRLEEKYKKVKEYAKTLADKYARTNFDDVSETYKEAFNYFKDGKIEKTLELLEKVQLIDRIKSHIDESGKIENITKELLVSKTENEKGIKEDMEALGLAAEMYNIKFDYEKADKMYYTLWLLDTANVKNILKYAGFLTFNEKHSRAIDFFIKLTNLDVDDGQKAMAYSMIGQLYQKMGDYAKALEYFEKQKETISGLVAKYPDNTDYATTYSATLSSLADIQIIKGEYQSAIGLLQNSLKIVEEHIDKNGENENAKMLMCLIHYNLYLAYEKNGNAKKSQYHFSQCVNSIQNVFDVSFEGGVMDTFTKANKLWSEGKLTEAITCYEEYKVQCKNRLDNFTMPVVAMRNILKGTLADAYGCLGTLYGLTGNTNKAIENYKSQLEILMELQRANPETMEYRKKLANAHSAISGGYRGIGDGQGFYYHILESNQLFKDLYEKSPDNFELSNSYAMSYIYLGDYYNYFGFDMTKAISNYNNGIDQLKVNLERDKNNINISTSLVSAYLSLGEAYQKNNDLARATGTLNDASALSSGLHKLYPDNPIIKQQFGNCNLSLGNLYNLDGNGEKYFRTSRDIFQELYDESPDNQAYISMLANTEYSISSAMFNKKEYVKALEAAEHSMVLKESLIETDPNNFLVKNNLAYSYTQVGFVHETIYEFATAIDKYIKALSLFDELYKADTQNQMKKYDVATAYFNLGKAYYKFNRFKQAAEDLNIAYNMMGEINKAFPNPNIQQQMEYASIHLEILNNDFSRVIEYQNKMISYYNNYPKESKAYISGAYYTLSFFYSLSHEFIKAKEAALKAIQYEKTSGGAQVNLAIARVMLGEFTDAEKILSKIINEPVVENASLTYKDLLLENIPKLEYAGLDPAGVAKLKILIDRKN